MQKIRLSERQILMLQKLKEDKPKTKVLRIDEDQYKRLFKGGFNTNSKVSRSIDKADLDEGPKSKVSLLKFAQELIVFIKDMLSRPESAPFSKFWLEQGISKDRLVKMLEKEGLLESSLDEASGTQTYVAEKYGFRRKVKECYKKIIKEWGDAGYPAGADNNPNAPWNQSDPEPEPEVELGIKADKKILDLVYYNEDMDGLCIFKKGNDLFSITVESLVTFKGEKLEPYLDSDQSLDTVNGETASNFINDKLAHKEIKAFAKHAPDGELALITPELKEKLIHWYGEDKTLVSILNNVIETTGAASSGAYVGGASMGPIKKDTGDSPEKAIGDLINDGYDDYNPAKHLAQLIETVINDVDPNLSYEHFARAVAQVLDDSYGKHVFDKFLEELVASLPIDLPMGESTTTTSAGGESGTFAYDVNALGNNDFMMAGNKENKKMGDMPIVKRPIAKVNEEDEPAKKTYLRALHQYKLAKKSGINLDQAKARYVAAAKNIDITVSEGKKVLKITEAQLKRILEADNMTSTAFPNGEMVDFDDCVKFNNNTKAQDGGCSQGAVDNVVKTKKTKSSVVAKK